MYLKTRDAKPDIGAHEYVSISAGLTPKLNAQKKVFIVPNPNSSFVDIINTDEDIIIQLLNVAGRLMLSKNETAEKTQLDVAPFPPGFYFIKIGNETRKINISK